MKVIEQYIMSKTGDLNTCEDGLLATEHFVCVVDGVSAKGNLVWDGNKTSGQKAKEIVLETVKNFDKDIDAVSAIYQINQALYENYKHNLNHFLQNTYDRLEACVLIFSREKQQIWSYGDCQAMVNGKLYSFDMKVDKINSEMRALYNQLLLASGMATLESLAKEDLGQQIILPTLKIQSVLANKNHELGYPVLNGVDFNQQLLKVINVLPGSEIVLASDGYPYLKNSLKQSESELDNILQKDRLLINLYKSTKGVMQGNISFDDRTYIKFIS